MFSKGSRSKGFTQSMWNALLVYWEAVCRHGPCGPISSLHPWDNWIPPDLHGFYKTVFGSLEVLGLMLASGLILYLLPPFLLLRILRLSLLGFWSSLIL